MTIDISELVNDDIDRGVFVSGTRDRDMPAVGVPQLAVKNLDVDAYLHAIRQRTPVLVVGFGERTADAPEETVFELPSSQ